MLFVVSFNFFLFRIMPSDPVAILTRVEGKQLSQTERQQKIEELLFEQSFDSGKRRSDAAPQLPSIPQGSDIVLQRAERIRGGACIENDAVSCKSITGVDTP